MRAIPHLPSVIPYPRVADAIFQYAELLGLLVGLLVGIIVFRRSKTRGYAGLFWTRWFIGAVMAFVLLAFGYLILLNAIDTPAAPLLFGEALLYLLLHAALAAIAALIVMLGPKGLIQSVKGLLSWLS